MKNYYLLYIALTCFTITSYSQNFLFTTKTGSNILLGIITESGLKEKGFEEWFIPNYEQYETDSTLIPQIQSLIKDSEIKIFMGTWCPDSRREVPRILKILHCCNFDFTRLTIIAVDYESNDYKQSPGHEEEDLEIYRVPTILFYRGENEIGRIVESPVESLEKDIISIFNSDYRSKYDSYYSLLRELEDQPMDRSSNSRLVRKYDSEFKGNTKLVTLAHVLFDQEKIKEALEVMEIQIDLNPQDERSLSYFREIQSKIGLINQK